MKTRIDCRDKVLKVPPESAEFAKAVESRRGGRKVKTTLESIGGGNIDFFVGDEVEAIMEGKFISLVKGNQVQVWLGSKSPTADAFLATCVAADEKKATLRGGLLAQDTKVDINWLESELVVKEQVPNANFGTLTVKVVKGVDIKPGQGMFGKADPYTKLKIGSQEHQTKPHVQGGKNPVWNQELEFLISTEKEMEMEIGIFDKEQIGFDKSMGRAKVSIMDWIAMGRSGHDIPILDKADKEVGKVRVEWKLLPGDGPLPGANAKQKLKVGLFSGKVKKVEEDEVTIDFLNGPTLAVAKKNVCLKEQNDDRVDKLSIGDEVLCKELAGEEGYTRSRVTKSKEMPSFNFGSCAPVPPSFMLKPPLPPESIAPKLKKGDVVLAAGHHDFPGLVVKATVEENSPPDEKNPFEQYVLSSLISSEPGRYEADRFVALAQDVRPYTEGQHTKPEIPGKRRQSVGQKSVSEKVYQIFDEKTHCYPLVKINKTTKRYAKQGTLDDLKDGDVVQALFSGREFELVRVLSVPSIIINDGHLEFKVGKVRNGEPQGDELGRRVFGAST